MSAELRSLSCPWHLLPHKKKTLEKSAQLYVKDIVVILWEEGAAELLMSLPAVGTYVTGNMGTASPFTLLVNLCLM